MRFFGAAERAVAPSWRYIGRSRKGSPGVSAFPPREKWAARCSAIGSNVAFGSTTVATGIGCGRDTKWWWWRAGRRPTWTLAVSRRRWKRFSRVEACFVSNPPEAGWVARGLIGLIRIYQRFISPLLGQHCRFTPSCSQYAVDALRLHGVFRGIPMACWRILRCQPFCNGGHDPVPPARSRDGAAQ